MFNNPFQRSQKASYSALTFSQNETLPSVSEFISVSHAIDDDYIRQLKPNVPVSILEPQKLVKRTQKFVKAFTGHPMYAVKCNPDSVFLEAMYHGGIKRFDVASIGEVRLVKGLFPDAKLYFMHPIKAPEAIYEAYKEHGVRAFVLDYAGEVDKIIQATGGAKDLELFVRIAIPKNNPGGNVATDFSSKFGAKYDEGVELLKKCRPLCKKLGLSFHVGTQCHDPSIYAMAVDYAAMIMIDSGMNVEALDVGGGFPADLNSDQKLPPIQKFTKAIARSIKKNNLEHLDLLCEIGRGLVASAGSLIVRIEGRKNDLLYLNDGTYGGLFEAGGAIGLAYPAHPIRRENKPFSGSMAPFRFAGPTCDSVDMMRGPFMLPDDIQVGDWIRLEQLGAYGEVSRTDFNGFGRIKKIVIKSESLSKKGS